ncbi:hypothetical protein M8C21_019518, partial [Ambrosia artemisiifolia]
VGTRSGRNEFADVQFRSERVLADLVMGKNVIGPLHQKGLLKLLSTINIDEKEKEKGISIDQGIEYIDTNCNLPEQAAHKSFIDVARLPPALGGNLRNERICALGIGVVPTFMSILKTMGILITKTYEEGEIQE